VTKQWEPDWPLDLDEDPVPLDLVGGRDDLDGPARPSPLHSAAPDAPARAALRRRSLELAPSPRREEADRLRRAEQSPTTLTAADFTVDRFMRLRERAPRKGWQKTVYQLTGGRVNPGLSYVEQREQELLKRITAPLEGMLGHVLASMRGDRVVALDANPDAGTLGYRVRRQTTKTVKDLMTDAPRLGRYIDMRNYASQAPSRLEVVASDNDPRVSEAFGESDYRAVSKILERFYSIILTDCGTGILHSTMRGILDLANQLVVVTAPSLDGGRSASLTLDWLDQHDRRELVENAVVAINSIRPRGLIDLPQLEEHFRQRCRAVVRVPFDPHLEAGAETSLDELTPETHDAYLELTAAVADGFRV
jgi:MinD-like ATPase involved in chromosome partitioning or flagellar assembly